MGFFSDLKEDLSQAVNEVNAENEEVNTDAENADDAADEVADEDVGKVEDNGEIDLNALLDSIGEETKAESNDSSKSGNKATDETAVITQGMTIVGDIASSGSLEVLGSITGNISVNGKLNVVGAIEGNSKAAEIYAENANIVGEVRSTGSVKIGHSTVIIGDIFATSAVIAGAVKGDIDVKGPVVLDTSAIVMGNIKSKSVQINNGAVIEGVCSQCYADVSPTSFFDEFKKNRK